jgi:hypothetical protein
MPAFKLPFSATPPISTNCNTCGLEMRMITIQTSIDSIVYRYECANGHQHEIIAGDKKQAAALAT